MIDSVLINSNQVMEVGLFELLVSLGWPAAVLESFIAPSRVTPFYSNEAV